MGLTGQILDLFKQKEKPQKIVFGTPVGGGAIITHNRFQGLEL